MTSNQLIQWLNIKVRFTLAKLPYFPVRYTIPACDDLPILKFRWNRVFPTLAPESHAFHFQMHGWDLIECRFLQRVAKHITCFADVGAHHGLYSVVLNLVNPLAEVHAFEPSLTARRQCLQHFKINGLSTGNVSENAISDSCGSSSFLEPPPRQSTLGKLARTDSAPHGGKIHTVQTTTLDTYFNQLKQTPDLVKIDVEGHEISVLEGAEEILARQSTIWIFEALDQDAYNGRVIVEAFQAKGLNVFELTQSGRLKMHQKKQDYAYTHLCNYVAIPPAIKTYDHLIEPPYLR